MYEFRSRRQVEFADTDMAGIVHFSRFFVFMESAEHAFLRALGCSVHFEHQGRTLGWPRIEAECRYRSPARLGDELEIIARVLRKGRRSITWGFTVRTGARLVAEGRIASICCVLDPTRAKGALQPVAIPRFLADQIEETPPAAVEATA